MGQINPWLMMISTTRKHTEVMLDAGMEVGLSVSREKDKVCINVS
jgi:hypothetical protein